MRIVTRAQQERSGFYGGSTCECEEHDRECSNGVEAERDGDDPNSYRHKADHGKGPKHQGHPLGSRPASNYFLSSPFT